MRKNLFSVFGLFFIVFIVFITNFYLNSVVFGLTVISNNGAIVYYNDRLIGIIKNESISFEATFPGYLRVVKPGYIAFEKMITQDGTVVANLSLPAYLIIYTSPEDAEVYINNEKIIKKSGQSELVLGAGEYNVKVKAPGYVEKELNVKIKEGEEKILEVALKKTVTLSINLSSKIQNTSLRMSSNILKNINALFNDRSITLPTVLEVPPGFYRIILPEGFYKKIQEFYIPAVEKFEINVDATRMYNLSILGEPETAYAIINEEIYKMPFNKYMPEDTYRIRIYSLGYKEIYREVLLTNDLVLNYSLEPVELYDFVFKDAKYTVELNGFSRTKLPRSVGLVTIKDEFGRIVWLGFSDGKLDKFPSTIPVIISSSYQIAVGNQSFIGPAIVQLKKGSQITLYSKTEGTRTINIEPSIAEKPIPIIFDDDKTCLTNIFSKTSLDVFLDNKYIGKTPIYLHEIATGFHDVTFKRDNQVIYTMKFNAKRGIINEIIIDY